jgi:hypothetical protein
MSDDMAISDSACRTGSCLCGKVSIKISSKNTDLGVCHCPKCQKWSGGPLFEIECGKQVEFDGLEHIHAYQSSSWGERGFCSCCGSHLYFKDLNSGDFGIPPGLFEDTEDLQLKRQVFFDKKPIFYSFSDQTHNITSQFIYQHYPFVKED